jgi:transcriptional regulator with AAA-type ATPase domain
MKGSKSDTTRPARRTSSGSSRLAAPRPAICWVFPELIGRMTTFERETTVLGRGPGCDLELPGEQMSRQHAAVIRSGDRLSIRDVESTNGVFLNGARVTEAEIKTGDVLRVGEWIGVAGPSDAEVDVGPGAPVFQEISPGYWGGPTLCRRISPARRAARSDLPIIVNGETGTGKEGVARSIHQWSGRQGPFLALNCAALPENMAEGELFGYRKGAFTGADRANLGYLRTASTGTLFLDEIVDLPLPLQAKLLRALEQKEVVPLGEATPVSIDVRIVSAAQSPLPQAVKERRFRADLLARLDGLTVELPPLRQRIQEVLFLFTRLMAGRAADQAVPALDCSFAERLCLYDWPSNVRELDLLARQMLALHGDVPLLERSHLPERIRGKDAGVVPRGGTEPARGRGETPDLETFAAALRANQGNVKRAAAALGISRAKAYRLMETATKTKTDLEQLRKQVAGDTEP